MSFKTYFKDWRGVLLCLTSIGGIFLLTNSSHLLLLVLGGALVGIAYGSIWSLYLGEKKRVEEFKSILDSREKGTK